jgi:trimeric autotransporter adhesin
MPNKVKLENPIHPVSLTQAQDATLTYIDFKTFIWKGTWSGTSGYNIYDVVFYNGSSYVNQTGVNTATNPASDLTNWSLMVSKGDTGATGATGAAGVVQSVTSAGSPITIGGTTAYPTVGINQSLISIGPSQVTGIAITQADTGTVTNSMLTGSIADSKLNTISSSGKVANSATTATSTNTANTIVARDSSGNTAVNQITISASPDTWNSSNAVTKSYADSIAAGMNWHDACDYATTTILPNSPTYTDGTADASNGLGVGAYLQATVNATLSIDGNTTWTVGQRVLVKDQANARQNGIYTVSSAGSGSSLWKLIRATDTDNSTAGQVKAGDSVFIISGPTNAGQGFVQTIVGTNVDKTIKINGTTGDNIAFTQFTGIKSLGSQPANTVLAAPNGSAGTPTFRPLTSADLPSTLSGISIDGSASDISNAVGMNASDWGQFAIVATASGSPIDPTNLLGNGSNNVVDTKYFALNKNNTFSANNTFSGNNVFSKYTNFVVSSPINSDSYISLGSWTVPSGWTQSLSNFTHSSGTNALTNSLVPTNTTDYFLVEISINSITSGSFTVSFGGVTSTSYSSTVDPYAYTRALLFKPINTTGSLTITPSTDFVGTINVGSIIRYNNNLSYDIKIGDVEVRSRAASNQGNSIYIGLNSGNKVYGSGSASYNVAVGQYALENSGSASYNTAIGYYSLNASLSGPLNTAVGYISLQNNTYGQQNVAVGASAMSSNSTGNQNTAVGYTALQNNTSGSQNTAIGQAALGNGSNITSTSNTAIGYTAGNAITSIGTTNTFVGAQAGSTGLNQLATASNSIAIGYQTYTTASNQIMLGNQAITETRLQAPTVTGTATSLNALFSTLAAPSTSTSGAGGTMSASTTYYYVMTAVNSAGVETVKSAVASRTTGSSSTGSITLTWTRVTGANNYKIYRSNNSSESWTSGSLLLATITSGATATYTDTGSATTTGFPPTAPAPASQLTVNGWNTQTTNANVVVKAGVSQTSNMQEWQNGSGTVLASINTAGNLTANTIAVTDQATTRTNIGLGNVDNTSDVNKPISNATQTALNTKADFNIAVALSVAL